MTDVIPTDLQGPCPACEGYYRDIVAHYPLCYRAQQALQRASEPTVQAPEVAPAEEEYVRLPRAALTNRPVTINDLPSPFEGGIPIGERLRRLNDKLNAS